jgi:hypothetical protein
MQVKPVESKAKFAVLSSNNRKISVTHLSPWSKNESFLVRIHNPLFEIKSQGRESRKSRAGEQNRKAPPGEHLSQRAAGY